MGLLGGWSLAEMVKSGRGKTSEGGHLGKLPPVYTGQAEVSTAGKRDPVTSVCVGGTVDLPPACARVAECLPRAGPSGCRGVRRPAPLQTALKVRRE